jgi:hypothetical protein
MIEEMEIRNGNLSFTFVIGKSSWKCNLRPDLPLPLGEGRG